MTRKLCGGVLWLGLLLAMTGTAMGRTPLAFGASAGGDAGPCATSPESGQLDFWMGKWKVGGPGAGPNAVSRVHMELDGCMVVESWDGGRGHRGENMLVYSADDKEWHGMFADNEGRVHIFTDGKAADGAAEFTGPSRGPNGETVLNRVRIVRVSADKVQQLWQKSQDNGATWETEYRGEYTRIKP